MVENRKYRKKLNFVIATNNKPSILIHPTKVCAVELCLILISSHKILKKKNSRNSTYGLGPENWPRMK